MYLNKACVEVHFGILIKTPQGKIWAVRIERHPEKTSRELNLAALTALSLQQAHEPCGHDSLIQTKTTAKKLGWKLNKTPFLCCKAYATGKAKQANLGPGETKEPTNIGDLWYINGMSLKKPKTGDVFLPTNNCLTLAVEHKLGAIVHGWFTTKNGFIETFCSRFHHLRKKGK